MSKSLAAQNQKLLQVLHSQQIILQKFPINYLAQIANKANVFVFTNGTILAQQKQEIDYLGIVLQGKVTISGFSDKRTSGFVYGHLKFMNLLNYHSRTICGDCDGLVLAIRWSQLSKMSPQIQNIFTKICTQQCLSTLKGQSNDDQQTINQQQKKALSSCSSDLKTFFTNQIDEKERRVWLKYFPFKIYKMKDLILRKSSDSHLLIVIKGQILVKKQSLTQKLYSGQAHNIEGFLNNYTSCSNIYCISEQATVMLINRSTFLNCLKNTTFYKFSNYLLRKQINLKHYQIQTFEKIKQKQKEANKKFSLFNNKTNFEVLPLNIPKLTLKENNTKSLSKDEQKQFIGVFYRQQLNQSKNVKTSSSNNSKINKAITLKTEKNQSIQKNSTQNKAKGLQKQLQQLNNKLKFYEENYVKVKLQMIQYQSKNNMNSVFKQIQQMGNKNNKSKALTMETAQSTTLKGAFQQELKKNRIMEVVARCAYKWLWEVRRKKNIKNNASIK